MTRASSTGSAPSLLRTAPRPDARTTERAKDTGSALALVFLLAGLVTGARPALWAATAALVAAMTFPKAFLAPSKAWFGLSERLGAVMSRILLGACFFVLVVPLGRIRRLLGHDPLRRGEWRAGSGSLFREGAGQIGPDQLHNLF